MRIRMLTVISGTRDGADWPARGGEVDLPDHEAVDLLNAGHAEPVEIPIERATAAPGEKRKR